MIRPTPTADITVQAAFRDIEERLRTLEAAEGNAARVRAELDNAVKSLRRDIAQVATKPTYLDFNDVFRAGPAHMHGYVPDPGNHPAGAGWTLGSDGTWSPGVVETVPHNAAGTSIAQRVVNVHGSMAVQSALSADTIYTRQLTQAQPNTQLRHGFELEPDGAAKQTITYNKATRVVTVTPTNGTFRFWIDGVLFIKTGAQVSSAHGLTTGKYYLKYDNTGTLVFDAVSFSIRDRTNTMVAVVYWNNTLADGWAFFECHTADRTLEQHYHDHFSEGTKFISGAALTGYTLTTPTPAGVTFAISAAVVADEDIVRTLDAVPDAGPYMTLWRSGASGEWVWNDTRVLPWEYDVGANVIAYNNPNAGGAGIWGLTSAGTGNFVPYFLCCSTSVQGVRQFFLVPPQAAHGTLAQARDYTITSIDWGTLPFEEFVALYRIIYRTGAGYGTDGRGRIEQIDAVRENFIGSLPGSPTDHGALTGLLDDDHTQYLKVEASGGTAAEVPDHTHADAADCGTVAHSALTGLTTGDDHTQYLLETAAATTYPRKLHVNTTPVGNVGAGTDDLITYALPGGTLASNGSYIHCIFSGIYANNAATKTGTVYFGSASSSVLVAAGAVVYWLAEIWVIRLSATTQMIHIRANSNGGAVYNQWIAGTETLANNITIKVTGSSTGAANDDMVQKSLLVEYYP